MLTALAGLMYCCINDKSAIRVVVDCLTVPSLETRVCFRPRAFNAFAYLDRQEIILDMFFDLLNIKPPEWHRAFIDGRRLTSE